MEGLRVQIICNKKLRGEIGERGRKRVSHTDLSLRRIWIAFVFTTTQGCVVCQRLALIMGFVSVCLRKWHACVYRCVCVRWYVLQCVCAWGRVNMGVEKMYMHMGDYIFKRVRLYACAFRHFHTHAVFSLCSRSLNKCGMGSWAGTSACACFFIR